MLKIDSKNSIVVFDLDDTLYKEIDFVHSAYKHLAGLLELAIGHNIYEEMISLFDSNELVFDVIYNKYNTPFSIKSMVEQYRYHQPDIVLSEGVLELVNKFSELSTPLFIITDGRSVSQRNKLKQLGIEDYFEYIFISDEVGHSKTNVYSFKQISDRYPNKVFYYFGDNTLKDFIVPNQLGWISICLLDNGKNIHKQTFNIPMNMLPKYKIDSLLSVKVVSYKV